MFLISCSINNITFLLGKNLELIKMLLLITNIEINKKMLLVWKPSLNLFEDSF